MFPPRWVFFLWWCILHHPTKALEKTALSHSLLQKLPHLWGKQSLHNPILLFIVASQKTQKKYKYHMIFSILKNNISALSVWFLSVLNIILWSLLDAFPSCLRSFSMAVQVSRSHITYFSITLKTEDPGHLYNTGLPRHWALERVDDLSSSKSCSLKLCCMSKFSQFVSKNAREKENLIPAGWKSLWKRQGCEKVKHCNPGW